MEEKNKLAVKIKAWCHKKPLLLLGNFFSSSHIESLKSFTCFCQDVGTTLDRHVEGIHLNTLKFASLNKKCLDNLFR